MPHITIRIDPVIAHFGPLALRWYSLAIITAIIVTVVVIRSEFVFRGPPVDRYETFVFWTVAVGSLPMYCRPHVSLPERSGAPQPGRDDGLGNKPGADDRDWFRSRNLGPGGSCVIQSAAGQSRTAFNDKPLLMKTPLVIQGLDSARIDGIVAPGASRLARSCWQSL